MLAQAQEVPLLDQGSVQFILFGIMVLVIYVVLKITVAK
jgi:hypothetical protein